MNPFRLSPALFALLAFVHPLSGNSFAAERPSSAVAMVPGVKDAVNWPEFFRPMDMVWKKLPTDWENAPFLGNGMVGVYVRQSAPDELRWEIGRADVEDHRNVGKAGSSTLYDRCRFAPGAFVLKTAGKITGCDLRLDLWNAELRGTVTTEAGVMEIRTFVPARGPMTVIADIKPEGGEKSVSWTWDAYPATSPRHLRTLTDEAKKPGTGKINAGYKLNDPAEIRTEGDVSISVQKLAQGATAVAWRVVDAGASRRLIAGVAHSYPNGDADVAAKKSVADALAAGDAKLTREHRAWWNAWYPGSFVSLGDSYWTAFYWAQLYKMASATRPDGVVLDLQGPWALRETPWPATWTNLNIQLTYWPTYVGNRLDLADSLRVNMRRHRENLIANVDSRFREDSAGIGRASGLDLFCPVAVPVEKKEAEIGSLLWMCHNLWWQYRVSMDDAMLREDVYPILRRAVNYHLHFLKEGEDGKLHLPETYSPEYGAAPDCNYDLALLKWGCRTLLWIDARLQLNDPLAAKWRDVDARLIDFPKNENGFMIGDGMPFEKSHRHFSHLFMIWPLRLLDADKPETKEIATRSVRHWHSMKGGLQGYSYTGGASLLATIGDGDAALEMLSGLKRFLRPNTMYKESGPVIETPLSANQSIQDMLLQSVGDEVRVFPAMPSAWRDTVFRDLRGEGGFLVSAGRHDGTTQWIAVKSLAGEPLKLRAKFSAAPEISGVSKDRVKAVAGGWDLALAKGEGVLLKLPGVMPEVRPISADSLANPFGVK